MPTTTALPTKYASFAAYALSVVSRYFFNDWDFLAFLLVFVAINALTDALVAFKGRTFTTAKISRFLTKAVGYAALLIVAHGLTNFRIHEGTNWLFKLVDAVIYTILMGREAICIVDNVTKLDPELLPEPLKNKLVAAILSVPERVLNAFTTRELALDPTAPPVPATVPEPLPEPAPVEAAEQPLNPPV